MHEEYENKKELELIKELKSELPKKINLQWIKAQVEKKQFILGEDNYKVVERCNKYVELRKKHKLEDALHTIDYHTMGAIIESVTGVKRLPQVEKLSEIEKIGIELHQENEKYVSYRVVSADALSALADSTDWCVRHKSTAESYLREEGSFLYIIFKKVGELKLEKYALSTAKCDMIKNVQDRDFDAKIVKELEKVMEPDPESWGLEIMEEYQGMKIVKIKKCAPKFTGMYREDKDIYFYIKDSFHDSEYAQCAWFNVEDVRKAIRGEIPSVFT